MSKEALYSQLMIMLNQYAPDDMTIGEVREAVGQIALIIANPRRLRKDWERKDARADHVQQAAEARKSGPRGARRKR